MLFGKSALPHGSLACQQGPSSQESGGPKIAGQVKVSVMDLGLFNGTDTWYFKLDVGNVFDEQYFQARTGDTLGEVLGQAMPGRTWRTTLKFMF
jgi:hypothetical protein